MTINGEGDHSVVYPIPVLPKIPNPNVQYYIPDIQYPIFAWIAWITWTVRSGLGTPPEKLGLPNQLQPVSSGRIVPVVNTTAAAVATTAVPAVIVACCWPVVSSLAYDVSRRLF